MNSHCHSSDFKSAIRGAEVYNYNNTQIHICVDKLENGIISGRVACPMIPLPRRFCDIGNMLLQTESLLDTIGYPCAFQKLRTFKESAAPAPRERKQPLNQATTPITEHPPGAITTVYVKITSRQNASWQGHARFEGGEVFAFKSALQFLKQVSEHFQDSQAQSA